MTTRLQQFTRYFVMVLIASGCGITYAAARGAAASMMDSPGYQRRLQESRGYVTNQSGSIAPPPAAAVTPPVVKKRKHRR